MESGCLWNSFMMVGRVDAFLKMTQQALPEFYDLFGAIGPALDTTAEPTVLSKLYSEIPEADFSHEVLARRPNDLAVMRVGEVGWSDLGEPN
jgi:mannose-1-phosphate guanylyltransferase